MFLRFVLSLALLFAVAWYCGELRLPTRRQTLVLAFMGFMGFFFHIGIQTVAMRSSGSATANWQMAAAPAMTALFAQFFSKRAALARRGLRDNLRFLLAWAVVLGLRLGTKGGAGDLLTIIFGDFLISLSVLNSAAFMVLTRWLFKESRYPPVFTIFWEIFFAVLMCLPALALTGTDVSVLTGFSWRTSGGARHTWFFMLRPGLRILVLRGGEHPRRQADGFSIFTAAGGDRRRLFRHRRTVHPLAPPRRRDDSIRRLDGKQTAPMRFKRPSDYMGISSPYHTDWRVAL